MTSPKPNAARRGFAAMTPEQRSAISSKGGKRAMNRVGCRSIRARHRSCSARTHSGVAPNEP